MRILVTGASGQLGSYLLDQLIAEPHEVIAWSGSSAGRQAGFHLRQVDLTDEQGVAAALEDANPDLLIHAAAMSSAEAVHCDRVRGWAVNVAGTHLLADWTARHDRRVVLTSTDLVFDGLKSWNREDDPAEPILDYGRTKRAAEPFVLAVPRGLVARISLLYGPTRSAREGFFDRAIDALRQGQQRTFFSDELRTPIDYLTASQMLIRLALSELTGIIHVGGRERLSRYELMRRAAIALGIDPVLISPNRRADVRVAEPRPADTSLDTTRLCRLVPDFERPGIEAALAARPIGATCSSTLS